MENKNLHMPGYITNGTLNVITSSIADRNKEILEWAGQKMDEEAELGDLCEKFPALKKAREQFETMKRLVQE
jgi:hypothetical protein